MEERRRKKQDEQKGDLGVAVRTASGEQVSGRIVLVSSERVTIAFRNEDLPDVEEGSRVKLLFRTIRGGELTATGRLVGDGGLQEDMHLLDFVFDSAPRTKEPSHESSSSDGDNRREAYRVKVGRHEVGMTMRPFGDPSRSVLRQLMDLRVQGSAMTVKGWVFDISSDGIGVLIEEKEAHAFELGDHLDLTFTLPEAEEPLMLGARVRHRVLIRAGVRYGLAFDHASTAHFHSMQREVLEFVMRQQQQNLRSRAS